MILQQQAHKAAAAWMNVRLKETEGAWYLQAGCRGVLQEKELQGNSFYTWAQDVAVEHFGPKWPEKLVQPNWKKNFFLKKYLWNGASICAHKNDVIC